jgi:tetratricopeptide (TPR) repeat protein
MRESPQEFEPWFAMELSTYAPWILKRLEESADNVEYASAVIPILPEAFKLYGVLDAAEKVATYRRQAIQKLIAAKQFAAALPLIEQDPDAAPELKAECYEGMSKHSEAADIFRSMGKLKDALRNYRSIPDFEKALRLMRELGGEQAAAESLEWIAELRQLLEKRPPNLLRTATAAEKQFLTALFEAQLDGPRVKKAPVKPRAPRKPGTRPAVKAAAKRK